MPFPFAGESLANPLLLWPAAAGVGGLLAGWLTGRFIGRGAQDPAHQISADEQARDLRKSITLLQSENRSLSTFLMTMPDLARQLNVNAEKRRIPQILTAFIEQLFEVEQVLVYLTGIDGRTLTLAGGKGLPEPGRGHEMIPFGHGRIGLVAESQITMDEADFKSRGKEATSGSVVVVRSELAAPMVSKDTVLGVISLSGLLRRPKNEKNMLKMVADLGSISMHNLSMFSQIQQSANMDGMTQLANKRHFMVRLGEEIHKAEKERRSLSLFLFDIDHFKSYNDANGHLAGDEALKLTGRLLRQMVRSDDLPARYGGEEFAVILPNTDKAGALSLAQKIRKAVESSEYPHEKSQPLGKVTISGGVSTCPEDGQGTADLIRCADQALYQCKRAGRNRVHAFQMANLGEETSSGVAKPVQAARPGQ